MRRALLFLFVIILFSVLGFEILRASHAPATSAPTKPSPSPAQSISPQDFQAALDRISKLEKENEELEKAAHENYPSELEKTSVDLSVVGTYIAIALTLAALVVALVSFNKFQDSVRRESRAEAVKVVTSLRDYLQGRFSFTIGYVLGQVAWDKSKAYAEVGPSHLREEAIRYFEMAHTFLEKDSEPEFKSQMATYKLRALNNIIFYLTLSKESARKDEIFAFSQELRKAPKFREDALWINTYCRTALQYLDAFAKIQKKSPKEVLLEIEELCKIQERNSKKPSSIAEFERIKTELASAKAAHP